MRDALTRTRQPYSVLDRYQVVHTNKRRKVEQTFGIVSRIFLKQPSKLKHTFKMISAQT